MRFGVFTQTAFTLERFTADFTTVRRLRRRLVVLLDTFLCLCLGFLALVDLP